MNRFGRSKDRLSALKLALSQFKHYHPRPGPSLQVPSIASVENLRAVLEHAPRPARDASGRYEVVSSGPGVRIFIPDIKCSPDEETASWGDSYRKELLDAFKAVVNEHGLGDEGWKSVRWEVYDKVGIQLSRAWRFSLTAEKFSDMFGGIGWRRNQDGSLTWFDIGGEWLAESPAKLMKN